MANFPSKWLEFSEYKEVHKLRQALTDTTSFKIELAVAIIVGIVNVFFSEELRQLPLLCKIIITFIICILFIYFFLRNEICGIVRRLTIDNILLRRNQAINIFDDEIVYDIMVAVEYYENLQGISGVLMDETTEFYQQQIFYYLCRAKKKLVQMNTNIKGIFGDDGNRISLDRVNNAISIINKLQSTCNYTDEKLDKKYKRFVNCIHALKE